MNLARNLIFANFDLNFQQETEQHVHPRQVTFKADVHGGARRRDGKPFSHDDWLCMPGRDQPPPTLRKLTWATWHNRPASLPDENTDQDMRCGEIRRTGSLTDVRLSDVYADDPAIQEASIHMLPVAHVVPFNESQVASHKSATQLQSAEPPVDISHAVELREITPVPRPRTIRVNVETGVDSSTLPIRMRTRSPSQTTPAEASVVGAEASGHSKATSTKSTGTAKSASGSKQGRMSRKEQHDLRKSAVAEAASARSSDCSEGQTGAKSNKAKPEKDPKEHVSHTYVFRSQSKSNKKTKK